VRELHDRLVGKGFGRPEVAECIRWLTDRKYLDDEAFARAFVRERIRLSPRSRFLLERELRDRGIAPALAGNAVEEVLAEEEVTPDDLAGRVAEKWVRKQPPSRRKALLKPRFAPEREKARRSLRGLLARRGFAGDSARAGVEAGEAAARASLGDTNAGDR